MWYILNWRKIFMHYSKNNTLTFLAILLILLVLVVPALFKTVIKIDSCAASGRCRVIFNDGTTDLLFNPYIGMRVLVKDLRPIR
jgi:hypothetical protein